MIKTETVTHEYESCGECPNCNSKQTVKTREWKHYCMQNLKQIKTDIWGGFPKWCPLPDKVDNDK
jgi:hypothetical protein